MEKPLGNLVSLKVWDVVLDEPFESMSEFSTRPDYVIDSGINNAAPLVQYIEH